MAWGSGCCEIKVLVDLLTLQRAFHHSYRGYRPDAYLRLAWATQNGRESRMVDGSYGAISRGVLPHEPHYPFRGRLQEVSSHPSSLASTAYQNCETLHSLLLQVRGQTEEHFPTRQLL